MSQIGLKFAELHTALFHAGKNFGLKLDPLKVTGLNLVYDRAEKELLVTWSGQTAIVPINNVASMQEGAVDSHRRTVVAIPPGFKTAQVETPMSHVHAGPGAGKSRDK